MSPRQPRPPRVVFGERVRARRHELGWTLEYLGDVSGMHWSYIGQIERGTRNLSLDNIVRLAYALDVNPGRLMDGIKPVL